MKKKKSIKREIIEWGIFLGIMGFLFGTGLHTPVFGFIQGLVLKTGIMQPSTEGVPISQADYNFTLIDSEGNKIPFTDLENEVVFINFWATWCPPCIAEMPDINSLYGEMKDEGINFVLISLDDDFQKAKDFVKRKGFDFPIYHLGSNLPEVYESQAIPTTYVISPKGKIVVSKSGMAKYNTKKFKTFLVDLKGANVE
jgi:thiol-disulfide isomerase/thioredoxin